MNSQLKSIIWNQFGAAIDMLENTIIACPEEVWGDRIGYSEFWYICFHTLFFLDLYLSESEDGFTPPEPFTLDELDERGILPERVYTKQELLAYLEHGREKCRLSINSKNVEDLKKECGFSWLDISVDEMYLYNMRHVQHHAAQLNFILSRTLGSAPRWVRQTPHRIDSTK